MAHEPNPRGARVQLGVPFVAIGLGLVLAALVLSAVLMRWDPAPLAGYNDLATWEAGEGR